MSAQIPTALFVEGHLANLTAKAVSYYFIQKGNAASGLILVKITNINGRARLWYNSVILHMIVWCGEPPLRKKQLRNATQTRTLNGQSHGTRTYGFLK